MKKGARSQRKRSGVTVQVHPVLLSSRGTVVDVYRYRCVCSLEYFEWILGFAQCTYVHARFNRLLILENQLEGTRCQLNWHKKLSRWGDGPAISPLLPSQSFASSDQHSANTVEFLLNICGLGTNICLRFLQVHARSTLILTALVRPSAEK